MSEQQEKTIPPVQRLRELEHLISAYQSRRDYAEDELDLCNKEIARLLPIHEQVLMEMTPEDIAEARK